MTNVRFRGIEDFRDIESLNHYYEAVDLLGHPPEEVLTALRRTSRDNARTPMQWSAAPNAGFTSGTPWIPANPNYTEINAATERDDPASVLAYYRALIALRHRDPVISEGTLTMVLRDHPQIFAYVRELGERAILVLANLTGEEARYALEDVPGWERAAVVLGNLPEGAGAGAGAVDGVLAPWEAVVVERVRVRA